MKIKKTTNTKITNYFYNLKITDKNYQDIYVIIKLGYTNDNILNENSRIYFENLNIISKDQTIKINKGYYRKNIIYVDTPIEIYQNSTKISIKKDIHIYMDKLLLVGKDVYIINQKTKTVANQINIDLKTLNYTLNKVSGTFYKQ